MDSEQTPSGSETLQDTTPVENPSNPVEKDGSGDTVAYESYQKLLSEKKKLQARLDKQEREAEGKQREELEAQQKYKELWESEKTEVESLRGKVRSYEERWDDALKLDAFNRALGDTRRIDAKYSGFIDTSNILIDPETGKIDSLTAKREVDRVFKEYPEIVKSTVTNHLPNENPNPGKALTREEWLKLPAKEMAARMREVIRK
jgi:hypothetical protein